MARRAPRALAGDVSRAARDRQSKVRGRPRAMIRLQCNGVELRVEVIGAGPPLLLIMGLGASLETWVAQREAFAARFRVILFDNRGAGESESPPPPWSVPDMAADAVGVLDALGIERAHVLGVSMGGMIAQEMAIG